MAAANSSAAPKYTSTDSPTADRTPRGMLWLGRARSPDMLTPWVKPVTAGKKIAKATQNGSALAVGLGFGLQNVFSNFVSGVIILLERSLKVGDFVELESGVRGHVKEIAMRYTRVTSNDALDVLVPNSEFINGRVVNWTLDDAYRRMHIPFGVAYGTPKELVQEAGIAAARQVEGVVKDNQRTSAVWLIAFGDSSVDYELVVWADRALTTRPAATHARLM